MHQLPKGPSQDLPKEINLENDARLFHLFSIFLFACIPPRVIVGNNEDGLHLSWCGWVEVNLGLVADSFRVEGRFGPIQILPAALRGQWAVI